MVIGDLVILVNSQTTGYTDGTVGIITRIEEIRSALEIFWILMPDGKTIPMWDVEFELLNGSRRSDNSS